MWMYDLAREQAPTLDHLFQIASLTQEAGFDALGLYLEHRFAYPSAPWAAGVGAVTPAMIRRVREEFPSLQLIPFANLLGHFEGMMYTEEGKQFREERFTGLQACPSNPQFVAFAKRIIDDVLEIFDSELIHIGGDETGQLGLCPLCLARKEAAEAEGKDGKAEIYGAHFGPLADYVVQSGRRPGVWGDMFLQHPTALDFMPKETLIFDWQYFSGVAKTAPTFTERGFDVVGCPAIQTYNATWMHLAQSERNVQEVARDVRDLGLDGVCVTTWECALMGSYDTLFPALRACGQILRDPDAPAGTFQAAYDAVSPETGKWARLMSDGLAACGGTFAPTGIRSSLKVRLLLNANPFLAWLHHADELTGEVGERAIDVLNQAMQAAPGEAERGITHFARGAVDFVRMAEVARQAYAEGRTEAAVAALSPCRGLFDTLTKVAQHTHERIGGSLADIERCRTAKTMVERAMQRIRECGDGQLGYRPAFEHLTHPKFVPHDQAAWWLINKWANQ